MVFYCQVANCACAYHASNSGYKTSDCFFSHAVSVTWNGSKVTGPVLIYHDEIPHAFPPPNRDHDLLCLYSANTGVAWHLTNGHTVPVDLILGFYQSIFSGMTSHLLRFGVSNVSTATHNGLWSCQLNGDAGSAIPVGLYQRGREYYSLLAHIKVLFSKQEDKITLVDSMSQLTP